MDPPEEPMDEFFRWSNDPSQDRPVELQQNEHWRIAVWALRVGYVGLAVALAGVIVTWCGSTPWVLAVGVVVWLAAAAGTLFGFFWTRHDLPEPRPGYWSMRFMLIHDTLHSRPWIGRPDACSCRCLQVRSPLLIQYLARGDAMSSLNQTPGFMPPRRHTTTAASALPVPSARMPFLGRPLP